MRVRIFQPTRSAMSSGLAKTKSWVLEYAPAKSRDLDPLMGWTSSADIQSQVRLAFDSKVEALTYAELHGLEADIIEPTRRKVNVRPGGYADNFATGRRGAWTH